MKKLLSVLILSTSSLFAQVIDYTVKGSVTYTTLPTEFPLSSTYEVRFSLNYDILNESANPLVAIFPDAVTNIHIGLDGAALGSFAGGSSNTPLTFTMFEDTPEMDTFLFSTNYPSVVSINFPTVNGATLTGFSMAFQAPNNLFSLPGTGSYALGSVLSSPFETSDLFLNDNSFALEFDNDVAVVGRFAEISAISAVPEPSSYAALFGLAGLGFAASKRRRRAPLPVQPTNSWC